MNAVTELLYVPGRRRRWAIPRQGCPSRSLRLDKRRSETGQAYGYIYHMCKGTQGQQAARVRNNNNTHDFRVRLIHARVVSEGIAFRTAVPASWYLVYIHMYSSTPGTTTAVYVCTCTRVSTIAGRSAAVHSCCTFIYIYVYAQESTTHSAKVQDMGKAFQNAPTFLGPKNKTT